MPPTGTEALALSMFPSLPPPPSLTLFDSFGNPYPKVQNEPAPVKPQSIMDKGSGLLVYAGVNSRDLPTLGIEEFSDPARVRVILREHANGSFLRAARLVEAMLEDARVAGCLEARIDGLQGLPFEMEPPKRGAGRRKKRDAIARDMLADWESCFPTEDRVNLLTWGYMLGIGLGQLVWETSPKRWKARLEVWNPGNVEWDFDAKAYFVHTARGRERITPGDGQWVLFTPYGYEGGWKRALVRRLAVPYCCRLFGTRDLSRSSEVNGNPARLAHFPRQASQADIHAFLKSLAALSTDSVIGMPVERPPDQERAVDEVPQWDVKMLESTSRGHEIFTAILSRADVDIAVAVNGQNLTTEVKGGSFAAASVHQNVQADKIRKDGRQSRSLFREQCLRPLVVFNYGEEAGDMCPYPTWDTEPPKDQRARAETLGALGTAAKKLRQGGFPIRIEQLAEEYNLELDVGEDGEVVTVPSQEILKEDLELGVMERDERRRALGMKPLGGKRGKEVLGAAAEVVPVPARAAAKEGPEAAADTLMTLLSLRTTALEQLQGGDHHEFGREARWFAKRHEVSAWTPAIERELARRSGQTLAPAAYSVAHPRPARAAAPSLPAVLRVVVKAKSPVELRARLVHLFKAEALPAEGPVFDSTLRAAEALALLAGTAAAFPTPAVPEVTP